METPIYSFTYTKVTVKETQLNVACWYVASLSPKERLLILENVLLILVFIIKPLSIKTTKSTKFFSSNRSIGFDMHSLTWRKGFLAKTPPLGFFQITPKLMYVWPWSFKSKFISQFPYSRNALAFLSRSSHF